MIQRKGAWAIVVAALGASPLLATEARAKSYTIETGTFTVSRLGPFKTTHKRSYAPTIGEAIKAFGRPSNSFRISPGDGCAAKWKRLGLRIEFYNFGVAPSEASDCEPEVGLAQSFTIERSKKWRTWKGLSLGMREERVWDLHPDAGWIEDHDYYPNGYWLRDNYSPIGDGGDYPILAAYLKHRDTGRVKSFYGWIGAAGE